MLWRRWCQKVDQWRRADDLSRDLFHPRFFFFPLPFLFFSSRLVGGCNQTGVISSRLAIIPHWERDTRSNSTDDLSNSKGERQRDREKKRTRFLHLLVLVGYWFLFQANIFQTYLQLERRAEYTKTFRHFWLAYVSLLRHGAKTTLSSQIVPNSQWTRWRQQNKTKCNNSRERRDNKHEKRKKKLRTERKSSGNEPRQKGQFRCPAPSISARHKTNIEWIRCGTDGVVSNSLFLGSVRVHHSTAIDNTHSHTCKCGKKWKAKEREGEKKESKRRE